MNEKLVCYIQSNENWILEEWHARFMDKAKNAGMGVVDAYHQILDGFFDDIISLLQGKDWSEIHPAGHFSVFTKNKPQLRLPHLLEVFLTGEELFCEMVASSHRRTNVFLHLEIDEYFSCIEGIFETFIGYYCRNFCNNCEKPVRDAHSRVIALGQRCCDEEFKKGTLGRNSYD